MYNDLALARSMVNARLFYYSSFQCVIISPCVHMVNPQICITKTICIQLNLNHRGFLAYTVGFHRRKYWKWENNLAGLLQKTFARRGLFLIHIVLNYRNIERSKDHYTIVSWKSYSKFCFQPYCFKV